MEGTASAVLLPFPGPTLGGQSVLQRMGSNRATSAAAAASAGPQAPRVGGRILCFWGLTGVTGLQWLLVPVAARTTSRTCHF